MDKQALAVLIPVLALFFTGLIAFSFTRLGKAVARRLEGGADSDMAQRIARLEAEQDRMQRELADAHERLDFAEREIARGEEPRAAAGQLMVSR